MNRRPTAEYQWNWPLIAAILGCFAFWTVVLIVASLLVA